MRWSSQLLCLLLWAKLIFIAIRCWVVIVFSRTRTHNISPHLYSRCSCWVYIFLFLIVVPSVWISRSITLLIIAIFDCLYRSNSSSFFPQKQGDGNSYLTLWMNGWLTDWRQKPIWKAHFFFHIHLHSISFPSLNSLTNRFPFIPRPLPPSFSAVSPFNLECDVQRMMMMTMIMIGIMMKRVKSGKKKRRGKTLWMGLSKPSISLLLLLPVSLSLIDYIQ